MESNFFRNFTLLEHITEFQWHRKTLKKVIITPFILFEFLRTPFGLKYAAQTLQRFMDEFMRGLDFIFVYIGLTTSSSIEEHVQHLHILFDRVK